MSIQWNKYNYQCKHGREVEVEGSRKHSGSTSTGQWDEILVKCPSCKVTWDRAVRCECKKPGGHEATLKSQARL